MAAAAAGKRISPGTEVRADPRLPAGGAVVTEREELDLAAAALLGLGAYVLGSFPTGYVLVRAVRGTDIRDVGGGNVGALNTYQQVGAWGGLLVLSVDAAKGALAALAPGWSGAPEWTVFLTTPLVVAGHNWPLFIGFRGGKGAASILGVSLVVAPALTLITAGPVVLVMLLARNVVWGAAFGFVMLNALLAATGQAPGIIALCLALTFLVTATYLLSIRGRITSDIRARRWRRLLTTLA